MAIHLPLVEDGRLLAKLVKDQNSITRKWVVEDIKGSTMQIRHGFAITYIFRNKVIKKDGQLYYNGRVPYKDNYNEKVKEYSLFYSGIN